MPGGRFGGSGGRNVYDEGFGVVWAVAILAFVIVVLVVLL